MDNKKLVAVLTLVTPNIIELIKDRRGLAYDAAAEALYNSRLYSLLEDYETGLWRLSPHMLYSLLDEELTTGKITFPEEQ